MAARPQGTDFHRGSSQMAAISPRGRESALLISRQRRSRRAYASLSQPRGTSRGLVCLALLLRHGGSHVVLVTTSGVDRQRRRSPGETYSAIATGMPGAPARHLVCAGSATGGGLDPPGRDPDPGLPRNPRLGRLRANRGEVAGRHKGRYQPCADRDVRLQSDGSRSVNRRIGERREFGGHSWQ